MPGYHRVKLFAKRLHRLYFDAVPLPHQVHHLVRFIRQAPGIQRENATPAGTESQVYNDHALLLEAGGDPKFVAV